MHSPRWRKSSYSGESSGGTCVELADLGTDVGIRDSKAPEAGHLSVSPRYFADLLTRIKRDELDV
ncbi:DUF397 domain-containing protein [Spirillospora sp. CA-128828]|uniref:DUF397 domain-containing protein n=1 Tax=Spirillospora sp. CA-128828 TaxID=3240033 RepID=UPI003D8ABA08